MYNIDAQPSLTVALTVTKADCTDRSSQIITFTACTAAFSFQPVVERPGLIRFFPEMDEGKYKIVGTMPKGLEISKADGIARIVEEIVAEDEFTVDYSALITADQVTLNVQAQKKDTGSIIEAIMKPIKKILGKAATALEEQCDEFKEEFTRALKK